MWVVKTQGESFYVNHVTADMPWSTKETPDNPSTKGSIKFKDALLVIDEDNCATLSKLSVFDKIRLRNQKLGITRILFSYGNSMHKALSNNEFKHSPFKNVEGSCGTSYVICDMLVKSEVTFATLKYGNFRVLMPNEGYYQLYDKKGVIWEQDDDPYEED